MRNVNNLSVINIMKTSYGFSDYLIRLKSHKMRTIFTINTVRNTLREIELQNDYCNGCGLTDHGCGMTLLSNELQIRTIGSIPGITGHN